MTLFKDSIPGLWQCASVAEKLLQLFGIAQMVAWRNGIINRTRPGYRSAHDYGRPDFLIHAERLSDRLQPPAALAAILVQTEN